MAPGSLYTRQAPPGSPCMRCLKLTGGSRPSSAPTHSPPKTPERSKPKGCLDDANHIFSTNAKEVAGQLPTAPSYGLRDAFGSGLAGNRAASGFRKRELQVVRATFDDCKESTIAKDLGITPRTVHTHVERLHRKLAVTDRLQLVFRIVHEFLRLTISPQGNLPPICANEVAGRCPLRS